MKKNLKPCVYKLWNNYDKLNRVLFVERSGELRVVARVSARMHGHEGKPSLNRALKSVSVDPKPGDLPMSRMKLL